MELLAMYEEIAAITRPLCLSGTGCGVRATHPYRCCEKQYCDRAARFAREGYGIELQSTGHPEIPFMGPSGCTVPLHLRPICTIHACAIHWAPTIKPDDPAMLLTQKILRAEHAAGRQVI